jgi:hypothetical protein
LGAISGWSIQELTPHSALSLSGFMLVTGQEATEKPFSLVATNPHPLRLVVLKEDLLMIIDSIR